MRNANPAALVLSAFGIALAVGLAVMIIGFTGYMAAARYRIFQPTVVVVPTATKILERRLRVVDFTLRPKVSTGPGIRLAAAQKDQLLRMGGLVHTVAGSAARFAVSNEGELYVTADSLVGVTELPAGINDKFTLLTLLTGEVFVALSEGTLQVQTPLALVEIRASAMRVSYDAKTLKEINASLRLGGLAEDSVDLAILTGEKAVDSAGAGAESTPEAAAADGLTDPVTAAPAEPARMTITLLDSTGILRIKQQEYLLEGGRTYVITKDGLLTPEGTPVELDALPIWLEVLPSSSAALRALMPTAVPTATSVATEQPAATTTSAAPATAVTIATAAASATVVASPVPSATLAASATVVVSPTAPVSGTATLAGSTTATPAASPAAGTTPTPSPTAGATTDIMSTLRADPTRFSTLISALEKAGLAPTFGTGTYTLFAPTNTAFSGMPSGALDFLLVDTTGLARLLKYHALGTSLNSSGITASQSVTSLAGVAVVARKDGTKVYYGTATVSQADITCTNGVIHVIDSVLYPVPAS